MPPRARRGSSRSTRYQPTVGAIRHGLVGGRRPEGVTPSRGDTARELKAFVGDLDGFRGMAATIVGTGPWTASGPASEARHPTARMVRRLPRY